MEKVAIVVVYYRENLSGDEQISLNHLLNHLRKYKKFLVIPNDINPKFSCDEFDVIRLEKKHFKSINRYSRLLVSESFYTMFDEFEYILIYQFDCLVFSDQLEEWCNRDFDYVGAPWFKGFSESGDFLGVGNGGFSLRKIGSFIRVLNEPMPDFYSIKDIPFSKYSIYLYLVHNLLRLFRVKKFYRLYKYFFWGHEDYFWSYFSAFAELGFKKPNVNEALEFAFECNPEYCYDYIGKKLPFGCHGWNRFERREFWCRLIQ